MATVKTAFSFTGGEQTWTVPPLVTAVTWQLWGAPGGLAMARGGGSKGLSGQTGAFAVQPKADKGTVLTDTQNARSLVGWIQGTTATTPGDTYVVVVGGGGGPGNDNALGIHNGGLGGFNGGGDGGYCNAAILFGSGQPGGGGGGATDVRHGGTALSNRILVAGGGGGAGLAQASGGNPVVAPDPKAPYPPYGLYSATDAYTGPPYTPVSGQSFGGPGGSASLSGAAPAGGLAGATASSLKPNSGGKGGGSGAGGVGGVAGGSGLNAGGNGTLGAGGIGAGVDTGSAGSGGAAGGGGGGGHYGGGGGGQGHGVPSSGGGGGGGSNFASTDFSSVTSISGVYPIHGFFGTVIDNGQPLSTFGSSNGFAVAQYVQPPNAPNIDSPLTGSYVKPTEALEIDWTFSSLAQAQTQSAFDLDYQLVGAGSWTSVAAAKVSTATNYTFPANFFTDMDSYNVRVRVYDADGDVSGYSEVTFQVNSSAFPSPAVYTAPAAGSVITTPTYFTVTIDPGETLNLIQQQIVDAEGNVLPHQNNGFAVHATINLSSNPSMETNATGWAISSSGGSVARSTAEHFTDGVASLKALWDAADGYGINQFVHSSFPTVPGQEYTLLVYVSPVSTGDPDVIVGVGNLGDTTPYVSGSQTTTFGTDTPGTFTQLVVKAFIAQGPVSQVMIQPASTDPTSGDGVYIDAFMPFPGFGAGAGAPETYYDGSNPDGSYTAAWLGTTNNSVSYAVLDADPTLDESIYIDPTSPAFDGLAGEPLTIQARYSTVASLGQLSDAVGTALLEFTVNPAPCGTPTISVTSDDDAGTNTVAYTTTDAPHATVSVDIYRTDTTTPGPTIRVATNLPPGTHVWVDGGPGGVGTPGNGPQSNIEYAYRIRALGADGYADAGGDS